MGNSGFHKSSIDIFETTEENRMDSSHFLGWIDRTASLLRKELGKYTKIVFVIDNAPWHNRLTNDPMPSKRSWRKEYIIQWLNAHSINVPVKAVIAELLEIAMKNLPEKRYEIDEVAKNYNVDILRLPIKHCMLNPVELAWADFDNGWKLCEPSEEFDLYQNDQHSCGVHLLTQAKAYINHEQHKPIPQDEINLYRHQIAEEILRKAEPIFDDSISDVNIRHRRPKHKTPHQKTTKKTSKQKEN
ncbi:unnamed protein product [Rotaria sordida]|uniref:Uncharacterized protein n=1 Tax=Rotaria sordida TaxID=392033 RepID=A0A814PV50_9BILA|nr:unnamed protein product [Rotaria sordida]